MLKYILFGLGIFTFLGSTLLSWYEGSAIMNNSVEWEYSTPFTKLFNIEIITGSDISQLDYFFYAAKFQPTFPSIMMISLFYIFCIIGYFLLKSESKWTLGYWGLISFFMLLLSSLTVKSLTSGGRLLFSITFISGLISISALIYETSKIFKRKAG